MYSKVSKKAFIILIIIVCAAAAASFVYSDQLRNLVVQNKSTEVHVHSDFAFYINDQKIDLTAEKYQSGTERQNHKYTHFHDGFDNVIHRHKDGIRFTEFMYSLGFIVNNTCLSTDTQAEYCTNGENVLRLYVNGQPETDIESYITQEEDKLLLYYGNPKSENIQTYLNAITEDSCMYSGNCPEKGTPPSESCGLTCEI